MKSFKLRFIYAVCVVVVCALYLLAERLGLTERKQTHFTVTSDTNVSKVPGLSKYATQEEVDSFAFRYWDIDYNSNPENVFKEPAIDVELKRLLKSKQTDEILKFMKDNNLTVEHTMHGGVTPVMYSSFWNDTNTTQELIKLGADIHKKDEYKLSAMAYAIENNSTKAVRLLLDNGVKFEEAKVVQMYLYPPNIKKIYIKNNKVDHIDYTKHNRGPGSSDASLLLEYVIRNNFVELAEMILKNGYVTKYYYGYDNNENVITSDEFTDIVPEESILATKKNTEEERYQKFYIEEFRYYYTYYRLLDYVPHYEKMLDLLLKYNVKGQPPRELLKIEYDKCYSDREFFLRNTYESYCRGVERINQISERYTVPISKERFERLRPMKKEFYDKHCPDANSTFKDTKKFIAWRSGEKEFEMVLAYLKSYFENGDTETVVNLDENTQLDTNK